MSREYFNRMANAWDKGNCEQDHVKLKQLAERLDIMPGSRVLDVGTGTGVLIPYLLARLGEKGRLVALDYAEEMLKVARNKRFKGNIEFVCADIGCIPGDNGSFDAVVCYSCFPHFQDKAAALKEISRILKSGGVLYICHTSSRHFLNNMHGRIRGMGHDLIPEEAEMQALLSAAGFVDITIEDEAESYLVRGRKNLP
jgi:ubiquinone/menaquinone biosynthesis C-methylase UbiE